MPPTGTPRASNLAERAVLAVCGYSGSGKTTLLEAVILELVGRGLSIGVIKHDAHGFAIDREGKDSDRFFRAGADVCLRGPGETAWRLHPGPATGLETSVKRLLTSCDFVLVEGHKGTPLPKVWLTGDESTPPPPDAENVLAVLERGADLVGRLLAIVEDRLAQAWRTRPIYGGLLIGGRSTRMGQPKQMLEHRGQTFAEILHGALAPHTARVVLLGAGPIPAGLADLERLPDPPELAGPLAGLVAALRWAPAAAWVLAACDLPRAVPEAVAWLLDRRRPGVRAVLPAGPSGRAEPLLAVYEPHVRAAVEDLAARGVLAPRRLRELPGVASPAVPDHLAQAWWNVNRPEDLERLHE